MFAYGSAVNSPPWDFGKLLGLYMVFFFLIARAISWPAFEQIPSLGVLAGGVFVVIAGIIIATASN